MFFVYNLVDSQSADKILDAPNLVDDYYLNLMDWSSQNVVALALGQSLYLWNAVSGQVDELLTSARRESQPTSVSWSADGRRLAVGFADSTVQIWDSAVARRVRLTIILVELGKMLNHYFWLDRRGCLGGIKTGSAVSTGTETFSLPAAKMHL